MTSVKKLLLVGICAAALSACGTSPQERAVTGAGIGGASGAIAGALIPGLSVLNGALIGVGAGALGGVLTAPQQ